MKEIRRICRVCPEGQKYTEAAIEYDSEIPVREIGPNVYRVENRTISKTYVTDSPDSPEEKDRGRYVILVMSTADSAAVMAAYDKPGPEGHWVRLDPRPTVKQVISIKDTEGNVIEPWETSEYGKDVEPIVDSFTQHCFYNSDKTVSIEYNLYLPEKYDGETEYPLVLYIHDKGPLGSDVKTTLRQGIGALVFADKEAQKKRPCIVLAPQFQRVPCEENPELYASIFELVEDIINSYAVDRKKVYATGQSMGGMTSIAMGIDRPDFFTAFLLVACQWDAQAMKVLSNARMFILVSRGDPRAYPGMNKSLELMEECGAVVSRGTLDWSNKKKLESQVEKMREEPANIYYGVLRANRVHPSCHMDTWKVAYNIEGPIKWLFEQTK